ncbi:MAG: putative dsRNA-binding protein, partial [Bdellovibrionota bacterium]
IALSISLQDCVRLGKGETRTKGNEKPSILSSTFEALIAAIYLDGGFHAVYPVVRHLFAPLFEEEREWVTFYDHKTQLQEMVQARWKITPSYHLRHTHGPDHAKTFEVEVRMKGKVLAVASGSSKKDAEQAAAKAAIENVVE